jgi:hypothetical protein
MTADNDTSLQELFLRNGGQPVLVRGRPVVQMDRVSLPDKAQVTVCFVGSRTFTDNAAVVAIRKPGTIFLSDGTAANAVMIWDETGLPRCASHTVDTRGNALEIYNKYRTRHSADFQTEDSFTGNAGMIVTELGPNMRRYECSNGPGPFSPNDLVFELTWEPMEKTE